MKTILGTQFYSRKETAEILGVKPNAVSAYTTRLGLKPHKIGGRNFYTEESVRDFIGLHQNRREPPKKRIF